MNVQNCPSSLLIWNKISLFSPLCNDLWSGLGGPTKQGFGSLSWCFFFLDAYFFSFHRCVSFQYFFNASWYDIRLKTYFLFFFLSFTCIFKKQQGDNCTHALNSSLDSEQFCLNYQLIFFSCNKTNYWGEKFIGRLNNLVFSLFWAKNCPLTELGLCNLLSK